MQNRGLKSLEAEGFEIRSQIIWSKDRFGDRSQNTLWNIKSREDSGHGHSTQKPVECMRRPILNHAKQGEFVYDPFLGSGTTLVAAELTERVCIGLELDPRYCDVIVERWQNLTGKEATLSPLGAIFEHVKQGRRLERHDHDCNDAIELIENSRL